MRQSYRENGVVKKKEVYLMTYKLYWLNKKSDYPQIEREYPLQFDNIAVNAHTYFEEDDNLMNKVVCKVIQKEIKRKQYIDTRKHNMDEENKKFRERKQTLLNCGGTNNFPHPHVIQKENIQYMDKFTVTIGNKDTAELNRLTRAIALHDVWNRQYHNTVSSMFQKYKSLDDWSQDELMKVALCGVKYIKYVADIERENQRLDSSYNTPFAVKENSFNLIDVLFGIIGRIKLKNLIKIFPIDKTYDGDKWGYKDYFFTMDVLKEKGLDSAVGRDGVFDLMWDYENRDLREFTVFYMSCMSAMYKQQTGVGIAEKFCEDNGIGTYTIDRENGLLIDNQSGEIAKMSNKPSFMQIVK